MKSESVVIHKGGKEDKYKICVEDYVISYLKYETGTLELSEIFFYGCRERNEKEYIIYGAGRDKQLAVFDKYDLLDKIACRLTQGGPVFMVREKDGFYEVKGYDIFYCKNEEMQNYLIDRKQNDKKTDETDEQPSRYIPSNKQMTESAEIPKKHLHNAMSLQLGVIFVILIAIVINSTNSYDKIKQLNQSAQEVFFAIENQEAERSASADGAQEEIVVERDTSWENADDNITELVLDDIEEEILKPVSDETEEESMKNETQQDDKIQQGASEGDLESTIESTITDTQQEDSARQENSTQEDGLAETSSAEDVTQDTEALSRSITRYYEIERGDTLYTISVEIYGDISKVQEICELNQISDPDNIRYGQKIILP